MPIYEYECPSCGKFEVMQKITAEPLTVCETCGKPIHKLISATSFALKGTGWYATDYAKKDSGGGKASRHHHQAESEKPAKKESGGGCGGGGCSGCPNAEG
jgi:putative FmdB family regulatory protein